MDKVFSNESTDTLGGCCTCVGHARDTPNTYRTCHVVYSLSFNIFMVGQAVKQGCGRDMGYVGAFIGEHDGET